MDTTIQQMLDRHKDTFPVPVVAIANDLGLQVYETKDFDDTQSGSLTKEGDTFVIYVNARHSSTRKRFTIAHEIGHYVQDRDYFENKKEIMDDERAIYPPALNRAASTPDEDMRRRDVAANKFAAELLMPTEKFMEIAKKLPTVEEIAEFFHVSPSAASVRANQLLDIVLL